MNAVGVPNASIYATCIRACRSYPYASCTEACKCPCASCMCVPLQLVLIDAGVRSPWPSGTCTCGVFHSSNQRKHSTALVVVTLCTLCWWSFSKQHLRILQLALCGGGLCGCCRCKKSQPWRAFLQIAQHQQPTTIVICKTACFQWAIILAPEYHKPMPIIFNSVLCTGLRTLHITLGMLHIMLHMLHKTTNTPHYTLYKFLAQKHVHTASTKIYGKQEPSCIYEG